MCVEPSMFDINRDGMCAQWVDCDQVRDSLRGACSAVVEFATTTIEWGGEEGTVRGVYGRAQEPCGTDVHAPVRE
jgi:hypothetical protein